MHLAGDAFHAFVAHWIDPTTPESSAQNTTISIAVAETLRRARERPDSDKFDLDGVRHMHAAFAGLAEFEPHAIETEGQTPADTRAELERRLAAGTLLLGF